MDCISVHFRVFWCMRVCSHVGIILLHEYVQVKGICQISCKIVTGCDKCYYLIISIVL